MQKEEKAKESSSSSTNHTIKSLNKRLEVVEDTKELMEVIHNLHIHINLLERVILGDNFTLADYIPTEVDGETVPAKLKPGNLLAAFLQVADYTGYRNVTKAHGLGSYELTRKDMKKYNKQVKSA